MEVVAAIAEAEPGDQDQMIDDLATLQRDDETLRPFVEYLTTGVLPQEDQLAHRVALTSSKYGPDPVPRCGRLDSQDHPPWLVLTDSLTKSMEVDLGLTSVT